MAPGLPILPASQSQTQRRCSYAMLRQRLQPLGMTEAHLALCHTVGDVQRLARPAFLLRARRTHPDYAPRWWKDRQGIGKQFRRVVRAYQWVMALDQHQWVSGKPPLPTPILEHDYPDLGYGWHMEYR